MHANYVKFSSPFLPSPSLFSEEDLSCISSSRMLSFASFKMRWNWVSIITWIILAMRTSSETSSSQSSGRNGKEEDVRGGVGKRSLRADEGALASLFSPLKAEYLSESSVREAVSRMSSLKVRAASSFAWVSNVATCSASDRCLVNPRGLVLLCWDTEVCGRSLANLSHKSDSLVPVVLEDLLCAGEEEEEGDGCFNLLNLFHNSSSLSILWRAERLNQKLRGESKSQKPSWVLTVTAVKIFELQLQKGHSLGSSLCARDLRGHAASHALLLLNTCYGGDIFVYHENRSVHKSLLWHRQGFSPFPMGEFTTRILMKRSIIMIF